MKSELQLLILGLLFITTFAFFVLSSSSPSSSGSIISSNKNKDSKLKSMRKSLRGGASIVKMSSFSSSTVPNILYGTAWKKNRTAELVELAIKTGFRAIDTACQPKHYNEKGVGDAVKKLIDEGVITRKDIFLQTKYTPIGNYYSHHSTLS